MFFSYIIFIWAVALTILSIDAASKENKRSTCRESSVMQNFDITRWPGEWYFYSRHNHDFESGCDCMTTEIVPIDPISIQISNCCQMSRINNDTQTCNIGVNYARLRNPEKKDADFMYTRTGGNFTFV